jgi:glycosyltransferase involved in cell wall biosynthesis
MILFVIDCPTPQRAPVMDRLQCDLAEDTRVFYLREADRSRGWGHLPVRHRKVVLDDVNAWAAFVRALLAPHLEVVCLVGYRGVARVTAALVARARRVPLILRSDSNVRDELARPRPRRLVKRWYLRLLLGQPQIWAIGSANDAYWRVLGFRRRTLLPYVVPRLPGGGDATPSLRRRLGLEDRFVYVFVGRLTVDKGVTDLLEAYHKVAQATPTDRTALLVAGRGPLEPEVRRYAAGRGDCRYVGAVPYERLGAVYETADAVVVPSRTEPWGLVVNEALGLGIPVVTTDRVGAADDLCTDENGSRCRSGDPEQLAAAMLAEYQRGRRRVPRLRPPYDVAAAMAEQVRHLASPPRRR